MEVGRIETPHFFCMELKQYCAGWKRFAESIEQNLIDQMHERAGLFEEFITEQLYSGVNGREEELRPRYSEDPYFRSFRNPKAEAERYKKWKAKIQPPARSYLGLKPRDVDTPNLIIRGDFYASITAIPIAEGIRIESQGVSFSTDIEQKYGHVIYEIGDKARKHYIDFYMLPRIMKLMRDCGL